MSIYSAAVKKPITTILVFVALAILGIFSLQKLPIDLYPKIETNNIIVLTSYPGAGPQDVEANVTEPIENVLNGIANQKHITSESRENVSMITVEFNEGTDMESATNDIRDKLGLLSETLPDGAHDPMLFKFGVDDIPVQILVATARESTPGLDKILEDKVLNVLGRIDGVGSVSSSGTIKRQIQVYCDPSALEAYGLTIQQISAIIRAENSNVPAGQISIGNATNSIRVQGEFAEPRDLENIVVLSRMGQNVYLRDVARVEDTVAEQMQEAYLNGERSAAIIVNKQSGANSVEISRKVAEALPKIQETLPSDVEIFSVVNTSRSIVNTISSLGETILITFAVVMLVVFLFLGRWRATIIIILTIPISLVGSFIYLMLTGNTLNIISMSSLSIAIGMVVDDAIVVLENITTHIERGSYPKQAAVHATNEVAISVFASTLTMLAVFLPLTMVGGMTGIMFRQLGWIVSIIMIVSTICAVLLTPTLCAHWLRRRDTGKQKPNVLVVKMEKLLGKIEDHYVRLLRLTLAHRTLTVLVAIAIFVGSIALGSFINTDFMPKSDSNAAMVRIDLPVGTNVNIAREVGLDISRIWKEKYPEMTNCNFTVGQADASNTFATFMGSGNNIIRYNIGFLDAGDRKRSIYELADMMRADLDNYPGLKSYVVTPGGGGGNFGGQTAVSVELYGYDFEKSNKAAQQVTEALLKKSSCSEVNNDRNEDMPEYYMEFDRRKLAEHGLTMATAAGYISSSVTGSLASHFREDGNEYEIRVRLAPEHRRSLEDLKNILVATPSGQSVRLGDLGTFREYYTPPTIKRKDRERVITLSTVAASGVALSELVKDANEVMNSIDLPQGITYKLAGSYEQQQESFTDLTVLLVLILILVYIVMAAQFESLLDPFVIMFSVPFAFTGVILGLVLTGVSLSLIAFIGAIMLVGIVVKNGIVLIDYTRLGRERGHSVRRSILIAGRSRLRPVLMTTLTTVLGMVPMAIGIGEGSEMWQPMGVTVAFGLTISTFVTLVLIPTIYASFTGREIKRERRRLYKELKNKANS